MIVNWPLPKGKDVSLLHSRLVFLLPLNVSKVSTEIQSRPVSTCSVPRYQTSNSTGILTCLPSTTPFGLALGPDSPSMDEPSGGTLRFSGHWILTNVCVTQADILTSASSTLTYINASPYSRTLPYRYFSWKYPTASADHLVPDIFGARTLHQ